MEEIKETRFYAVLADEVVSSNAEHLAICISFVDAARSFRAEFMMFQRMTRITGKHIAEAIKFLQDNGLGEHSWARMVPRTCLCLTLASKATSKKLLHLQ